MMQPEQLFVGLDVGGTKTAVLLVDPQNRPMGQLTIPTQAATPQALLETISSVIHTVLGEAGATPQQVRSIGLGVPGQVDPAAGIVHLAVNLNLQVYPLGATIAARFKTPTYLENDVRTAAIGAYNHLRQTAPVHNIAYLSIGTGIAAGLILNGRLYRGQNGMAGEIGHMMVEVEGEPCNCGLRGCLETLVAGPAIIRQLLAAEPHLEPAIQTAGDVYRLAADGNLAARRVVRRVSQYLARAVQWLVMTYDVEKVVIGGGVARSQDNFLAPILQELARLRQQSNLAAELLLDEKLQMISTDFNPGIWGAVQLARQAVAEPAPNHDTNHHQ